MLRVFAVAVLCSCTAVAQTAAPVHPAAKQAPTVPGHGEQVLVNADREFARAVAARRLEGWMEYMADDAVLFSGKPVVGTAAIRTAFGPSFADPAYSLTWEPERAHMFPSGNMGYTSGHYDRKAKDQAGNSVVSHGAYITVWRQQADGKWKVVADGGAPNPK